MVPDQCAGIPAERVRQTRSVTWRIGDANNHPNAIGTLRSVVAAQRYAALISAEIPAERVRPGRCAKTKTGHVRVRQIAPIRSVVQTDAVEVAASAPGAMYVILQARAILQSSHVVETARARTEKTGRTVHRTASVSRTACSSAEDLRVVAGHVLRHARLTTSAIQCPTNVCLRNVSLLTNIKQTTHNTEHNLPVFFIFLLCSKNLCRLNLHMAFYSFNASF